MTIERFEALAEFKFADADTIARGEFLGYASTFGNVDLGGDIVERGAFTDTLSRRKSTDIAMLWGHDTRQVPIGKWVDIREDEKGLIVKGQLTLDIPRAREVHAALKENTVKGLSIGYSIPQGGYEYDRAGKVRRLKSIDLHEISVVTFPMNTRAQVSRVKSDLTIRDAEKALRDEGFSAKEAKAILAGGFKTLSPRDAGDAVLGDLRQLINIIQGE